MTISGSRARLAAIFVIFIGLGACSKADNEATPAAIGPDTIYINGNVITVDENFSTADAFAVSGTEFVAVGSNDNIRAMAGNNTRVIDLGGATLVPGMFDNHDHLWNSGKYIQRGVDMIGVESLEEFTRRLEAGIAEADAGEVVFTTTGWNLNLTKAMLDEIAPETPVAAIRFRRGIALLNTAALHKMGISREQPVYLGAHMPVDDNGELTGNTPAYPYGELLLDELLPPITPEIQDEIFAKEQARRHALGITSTRELAIWPQGVEAYQRQHEQGTLRIRTGLGLEFPDQENTLQYLAALGPLDFADPWLYYDSTGEEPWTPGTLPTAEFTDFIRELEQLGWRPAPHTSADGHRGISSDAAANSTLEALETIDAETPLKGKRWTLEHMLLTTPEQMQRLADLGIIVSTQGHGYWQAWGALHEEVPAERAAHYNPVGGFLAHGVPVIAGSDTGGPRHFETEHNNPMINFYFYVTRTAKNGDTETPGEAVSREQALRTLTTYPAWAAFQEDRKGQIVPGMWADFVILNQDPMRVPENQILNTRVLATYVGGNQVYAAPNSGF